VPWQYKNKPLLTGNKNNCRYADDRGNQNKTNLKAPAFVRNISWFAHYSTQPFSGDSNSISAITYTESPSFHLDNARKFIPKFAVAAPSFPYL
jgi:hypothetical protein